MTQDNPNFTVDEAYMKMALSIAQDGLGRVWPNPSVGCVIVNDGVPVGYGRTADSGRPHAEAAAIAAAGERAKGATAYVTLEPCAEVGREGPCSDALIAAGVSRVVVACYDPNPVVFKKGIAKLEAAGITVDFGLYEEEAKASHIGFFKRMTENRPMVTLKQAVSADGMIAAGIGQRTQISGGEAHSYMHDLRSVHDAVAVGIGTVLVDNPVLTTRIEGHSHAIVRVVFDSSLQISTDSALVQGAQDDPLWICYKDASDDVQKTLRDRDVRLLQTGACVSSALNGLAGAGITRLLIEGGAKLQTSFIHSGLVDEVHVLRSQKTLGADGVKAADFEGLGFDLVQNEKLGEDLLEIYRSAP